MLGNNRKNQSKRLGTQLFRKLIQQRNRRKDLEARPEDSEYDSVVLSIYLAPQKKALAQVVLNGYNIERNESFGSLGAMRSFKIVHGDLWDQWNEQTAVSLRDDTGQEVTIRIAALPVDDASFGLLEFISDDLSHEQTS